MGRFAGVSRGIMTHATLVKGAGTYEGGVERARINVVLATRIPRERCERVNLGYLDPDGLELSEWVDREDEGILLVPRAGEMLHRLKSEQAEWSYSGEMMSDCDRLVGLAVMNRTCVEHGAQWVLCRGLQPDGGTDAGVREVRPKQYIRAARRWRNWWRH